MSNAMDKFKLIAEIRKRPVLWDTQSEERRFKKTVQAAWKDVAVAMGSDVNKCSRTWKSLRSSNREVVKKMELCIQAAKLNGSYNPNNDYSGDWTYFEHMKFVNDIKITTDNDNKSDLEMSNAMDKFKLIGEIRKRPALWDRPQHRPKKQLQTAWKDVAVAMGSNVNECSRMWKGLRNNNLQIVKKIELRIKEAKLNGSYNPNNEYSSQWPYFKHMKFVNDIEKPSVNDDKSDPEMLNIIDKFKLIAEVRKRPALWDVYSEEYRYKRKNQTVWKDVAVAMGSNVNECRRLWKSLRTINREVVKKIKLRIQEAKLNGSYNPKNDYSNQWPYLEHMEFMNDIKRTSSMKLGKSNAIDKFKLIAEMRKRPALWDNQSEEHRSCLSLPEVWKDLAVSMGSDAHTCHRNWVHLCRSYKRSVSGLELRIQEAKQKGSYNPKTDYSSQWPYFEHMKFMKDNTNNSTKLLHSGDKFKLIAEIRNRPELWCIKSKKDVSRSALQKIWEDLAQAMGADVDDCKRKWTSLLVGYRVEVKKLELRIKEDKLKGSYNPNNEYRPKWIFYESMQFCEDIKNPSLMEFGNDNNSDDNDSNQFSDFQYMNNDENDDTDSQMSGMEFLSEPNSPQNQDSGDDEPSSSGGNCTKRSYDQANLLEDIEKEEHNLTKSAKMEPELDLEPEVYIPDDENDDTDSQMPDMEFLIEQNSPQNQESTDDKPSSTGGNCTKRSYDQANLLENLEEDEPNLIKSVRSNEMVPVTDSDYNFLVSFLPKMKKINELQNLQFRAKITDLMLDIAQTE